MVKEIKKYRLRRAQKEDMELLYIWANDADVRRNAFHQEKISHQEHETWFNKAMDDDSVHIYILCDEEKPVGQCRVNINEDGTGEIDYSIEKQYRGKGLGKVIIGLLIDEICDSGIRVKKLVARVKPTNIESVKCFEANGFLQIFQEYELKIRR